MESIKSIIMLLSLWLLSGCTSSDSNTHIDDLYKYSMLVGSNHKTAHEYLNLYVDKLRKDLRRKNESKLLEEGKRHNLAKATLENLQLKKERVGIIAGIVFLAFVVAFVMALFFILMNREKIEKLVAEKHITDLDEELAAAKAQVKRLLTEIGQEKSRSKELADKIKQLVEKGKDVERMNILLVEKRNQLLSFSPVLKKLQELACKGMPKQTDSPLTMKDWLDIVSLIDSVYPKLSKLVSASSLSKEEGKLCYLSALGFDTSAISLLLFTSKSTLYKNRHRAKVKLQIPDNYTSLKEYFEKCC